MEAYILNKRLEFVKSECRNIIVLQLSNAKFKVIDNPNGYKGDFTQGYIFEWSTLDQYISEYFINPIIKLFMED